MSDLEKQKKLTEGKGWKNIDFSRVMPYKAIQDAVKTVVQKRKISNNIIRIIIPVLFWLTCFRTRSQMKITTTFTFIINTIFFIKMSTYTTFTMSSHIIRTMLLDITKTY